MPATGVRPGPVSVKVNPVMVVESICWLKVAVIFWLVATPVVGGGPAAGFVEMTVGLVVFEPAPVLNSNTKSLARKPPATLSTPLRPLLIVTLYVVLGRSKLVGVKIPI